jgi:hypothetical protein
MASNDCVIYHMADGPSDLANWTPQQIADIRRWVEAWKLAGPELEQIRRKELRAIDISAAIHALCFVANYRVPPRAPKPTSGLIDQQYWFIKAAGRG